MKHLTGMLALVTVAILGATACRSEEATVPCLSADRAGGDSLGFATQVSTSQLANRDCVRMLQDSIHERFWTRRFEAYRNYVQTQDSLSREFFAFEQGRLRELRNTNPQAYAELYAVSYGLKDREALARTYPEIRDYNSAVAERRQEVGRAGLRAFELYQTQENSALRIRDAEEDSLLSALARLRD